MPDDELGIEPLIPYEQIPYEQIMTIGGPVPERLLPALYELMESCKCDKDESDCPAAPTAEAFRAVADVVILPPFLYLCDNASTGDTFTPLTEFCQRHGLAYELQDVGSPCAVSPYFRIYRPGIREPVGFHVTGDDCVPLISREPLLGILADLKAACTYQRYDDVPEITRRLGELLHEELTELPPFTVVEDAKDGAVVGSTSSGGA